MSWNDEGRISCEFSFQCPQQWDRLPPTAVPTIRHCAVCDRDVHLVMTEEDFRQHAEAGHCVAVRVITSGVAEGAAPVYLVGSPGAPYGSHLKGA